MKRRRKPNGIAHPPPSPPAPPGSTAALLAEAKATDWDLLREIERINRMRSAIGRRIADLELAMAKEAKTEAGASP